MRPLNSRILLSKRTKSWLHRKRVMIWVSVEPKSTAEQIYKSSRNTAWFSKVILALKEVAGPGSRCMYCSGNESSQIEHYRPQSIYPKRSMSAPNFLWVCGICNNEKGNDFPLGKNKIINPMYENVWDYFFIDQYGFLTPKWNVKLNAEEPRAASTISLCKLDREDLETTRRARLNELKKSVSDTISLFKTTAITNNEVRKRFLDWINSPFHPDVNNYFLVGPGTVEQPFAELVSILTDV